jgi:hypothetical protein
MKSAGTAKYTVNFHSWVNRIGTDIAAVMGDVKPTGEGGANVLPLRQGKPG